ncbi:MAG: hypothetical protein JRI68_34010 [Deltaproteobacteria bacterium]|nr:hypothetical protein [Deltaproteobacteria bacterium]
MWHASRIPVVVLAAVGLTSSSRADPTPLPAAPSPEEPVPTARADLRGPVLRGGQGDAPKPPPLHIDYVSYGVAFTADILADSGATCDEDVAPCILGSGGGLALRGGYRSPGPWYIGGAYQFSKTNSANIYRLGSLQQLRVEMRYMLDMGYRTSPYATWGVGGVLYGNEFGAETGGGTAFGGLGLEVQLSRLALLGIGVHYQPVVFVEFDDTAGYHRDSGMAQYLRFELQLEIRSELSRR